MITRPDNINALRMNPRTGHVEVNPLRDVTRSWAQGTQRNAQQSIGSNGITEDIIEVGAERGLTGDFEITHFTSDHTGPYRVELYAAGGTDKKLTNTPTHIDLVAGSAQYPFYLPVSLFLEAKNSLHVKFTNLSASTTNKIRFVAHGRRFLDYENAIERRELFRQFYGRNEHVFWLTLDDTSVSLTANSTGTRRLLTVPGDADFEAEYAVRKCTGPFRIVLKEGSGNSRPIIGGGGSSSPVAGVPDSHVFGTSMNPYRFTGDTAYFKRQTKIEAFFDDLAGATNVVEIALVGRLLYYPESPDRGTFEHAMPERPQPTTPVPFAQPVITSSPAPQGAHQGQFMRLGKPFWFSAR